MGVMRVVLLLSVASLLLADWEQVGATGPAAESPSTTLRELPEGAGRIIQRPDSGVAPDDSGDRGGAAQIVLFVVLVAAVGGGVTLVILESRRKRGGT